MGIEWTVDVEIEYSSNCIPQSQLLPSLSCTACSRVFQMLDSHSERMVKREDGQMHERNSMAFIVRSIKSTNHISETLLNAIHSTPFQSLQSQTTQSLDNLTCVCAMAGPRYAGGTLLTPPCPSSKKPFWTATLVPAGTSTSSQSGAAPAAGS